MEYQAREPAAKRRQEDQAREPAAKRRQEDKAREPAAKRRQEDQKENTHTQDKIQYAENFTNLRFG